MKTAIEMAKAKRGRGKEEEKQDKKEGCRGHLRGLHSDCGKGLPGRQPLTDQGAGGEQSLDHLDMRPPQLFNKYIINGNENNMCFVFLYGIDIHRREKEPDRIF